MNLLTIREAAEAVGVHRNTIRNWIDSGKLQAIRYTPRTIRIPAENLDNMKGKK
jgi:excisionase family DNA binding protein